MHDADQEQFARYWTQAQTAIAGYVTAMVGDTHVANDVLQDVAVAALRKFSTYDPQRPFVAWAMGIAKTQILAQRRDGARAASRFSSTLIDLLTMEWETVLPEANVRSRALIACIQGLDRRGRELIQWRYQEELAPPNIATRLGCREGAVRTALSRLRATLHACIERRVAAGIDG
ncbi:MAG: sigma-70 family RNA polymerase sigma factor [Planctomycetota bacterium]